jgi:hypothetical protein
MQSSAFRVLQIYLWFICAFHVVTGLGVNCSQPFMETMASGYGAKVSFTPQFVAILHPLGAFMFVLGLMAAAAALNPLQNRAVVYGFAALFVIRGLQRIVFKQQIEDAFQIEPSRNLINMVLFLTMGIVLAALQRYVENQRQPVVANR